MKKNNDNKQKLTNIYIKNPCVDEVLFEKAREFVINNLSTAGGIGTLSEKTIHAVLKYYYAPNDAYHEIKVNSFVADIMVDGEIIEIQTRNFNTMRDKLNCFLENHEVTIVYPVAYTKWISWIDPETGEMTKKHKSPKRGSIYSIMPELYRIKMFLKNPSLHFTICMIDVEESRFLNGWSKDKKRGSVRHDGLPINIYDEICFDLENGYRQFLPDTLPHQFTSKDLKVHAKINQNLANVTLNILYHVGIVDRIGKDGKAYLYEIIPPPIP